MLSSALALALVVTVALVALAPPPDRTPNPLDFEQVMLQILQAAPPTLTRGSNAFKELVSQCVQREPAARPPIEKLLRSRVLGSLSDAATRQWLMPIVRGLRPLYERCEALDRADDETPTTDGASRSPHPLRRFARPRPSTS